MSAEGEVSERRLQGLSSRRDHVLAELQRVNADPLAAPVIFRTLTREAPTAKALHFTYEMIVLGQDTCRARITYREHGTDLVRLWADELLVVDAQAPTYVPPQWTIAGKRFEFALRAETSTFKGVPSPIVRVYMLSRSATEEQARIRKWDPEVIAVVIDSNIWDLRILDDIYQGFSLYKDASFLLAFGRVLARKTHPVALVVDVTVSQIGGQVLREAADRYGKIHIVSITLHCSLCGCEYSVKNVEIGQEIRCPGCGVSGTVGVK